MSTVHELPHWSRALVVVAHPDDESFGLGAVIDRLGSAGTAVHLLCFTHGEASTLHGSDTDLHRVREAELRAAAGTLGLAEVTLLDYPDGGLANIATAQLAAHVTAGAAAHDVDGLLVFDPSGVTGHPDHQAATRAAVTAAAANGLPVLAWTLPDATARQLRDETGAPFQGHPSGDIDLCVPISRTAQRLAAHQHASQAPPSSVLWRRLELLGDCEHLRWLAPPPAQPSRSALSGSRPAG